LDIVRITPLFRTSPQMDPPFFLKIHFPVEIERAFKFDYVQDFLLRRRDFLPSPTMVGLTHLDA
jgi:hypothetical protein